MLSLLGWIGLAMTLPTLDGPLALYLGAGLATLEGVVLLLGVHRARTT